MNLATTLLVVAILLALLYWALGIFAFSYLKPEKKERRSYLLLIMDPWWPFYDDMYVASSRKLLIFGRILFILIVAIWIAWGISK